MKWISLFTRPDLSTYLCVDITNAHIFNYFFFAFMSTDKNGPGYLLAESTVVIRVATYRV